MIPRKLSLRNFMSYGDDAAEVDFAGMHVVSLSGDNGNGKSALLDAMTYSLWGKTRTSGVGSTTDDDLIRLGADNMEVVLEFELNEDVYRSVRKRKRGGASDWQVNIQSADGSWRALTTSGITAAAKAIETILRMQYDTFLNSAYIQQGRSDEFTRQKADKRKQILADILDLERYDKLEQMAKERKSGCNDSVIELTNESATFQRQIDRSEEVEQNLILARTSSIDATNSLSRANENLATAKKQFDELKAKQELLVEARKRVEAANQRIREQEAELQMSELAAGQHKLIVDRKAQIELGYLKWIEFRAMLTKAEEVWRPLAGSRETQKSAENAIAAEERRLRNVLETNTREQTRLAGREKVLQSRREQLAQFSLKADQLGKLDVNLRGIEETAKVADEEFTALKARSSQIKSTLKELEEVLQLLESPRPSCPVCETDLKDGRQEKVIARQRTKQADLTNELTELTSRGVAAKKHKEDLQTQAQRLSAEKMEAEQSAIRAVDIQKEMDELIVELASLPLIVQAIELSNRQLASGDFATEERESLKVATANVERLKAVETELSRIRQELRPLEERNIEGEQKQLERATFAMEGLTKEIVRQRGLLLVARNEIGSHLAEVESAQKAAEGFVQAESKLREAQAEVGPLAIAVEQANRNVGGFEQQQKDIESARSRLKIHADRLKSMKQQLSNWNDLAASFGKKGVQALIIDNVLPEIQDEANRLLSRMSDNSLNVELSTLRSAKSTGSKIETLDIRVSDDAGTRPYELYSGGEAFRINFALRIALSRLLARRAGASLQTLIIDEGFGTQDASGRERLVEAIESVKNEFKLILVISHIEELKDAFPTRIEVTKGTRGSQVSVVV